MRDTNGQVPTHHGRVCSSSGSCKRSRLPAMQSEKRNSRIVSYEGQRPNIHSLVAESRPPVDPKVFKALVENDACRLGRACTKVFLVKGPGLETQISQAIQVPDRSWSSGCIAHPNNAKIFRVLQDADAKTGLGRNLSEFHTRE